MTTKTARHEALLDEAEKMFLKAEYAKGAKLVWEAVYGSLQQAAAAQGLKYASLDEALETADTLETTRPPTLLPYGDAICSGQAFLIQADTRGMEGDWEWSQQEYRENLAHLRKFIADMDAIAQKPIPQ